MKLTFGQAIEALKNGQLVSREGWNGKGMFAFMQVPSEIPAYIIPNMTSLPPAVKDVLSKRGEPLKYSSQFALVKPDSSINGWAPSVADTLADDWFILEDDLGELDPSAACNNTGEACETCQ